MKKIDVVEALLKHESRVPQLTEASAFAPVNIALCKYWGKRDAELNLPMTSSLSIALPQKGSKVNLKVIDASQDKIVLNDEVLEANSVFVQRLVEFLNLFRSKQSWFLEISITMNVPVAAGLASSAAGYASIVMALQKLMGWKLELWQLSILARLGSGSAARSLWDGFVEWKSGIRADGMDSYAEPIDCDWPELKIGLLMVSEAEKPLSSRQAMQRTVDTSVLYESWPKKVTRDLVILRQAIVNKNFNLLGGAAESNALAMHATMLSSWPPVCFTLPQTLAAMHKIWQLRAEGLALYFTQDAGPNLKVLYQEKDKDVVEKLIALHQGW